MSTHSLVHLSLWLTIASAYRPALAQVAPSFALDGQLYADAAGTQPLADTGTLTVRVLDPGASCVLYEEQQAFDTTATAGFLHADVGSLPGATKRRGTTGLDSNHAMDDVYTNVSTGIAGKTTGGAGCAYVPGVGDARLVRVIVFTNGDATTRTLAPDLTLGSVPTAVVAERAESLRGLAPSDFLQLSTPGNADLTQPNLEYVFQNFATLSNLLNNGGVTNTGTGAGQVVQENTFAQIAQTPGSAARPAYTFAGTTNSGVFSPGAGQLSLATSGTAAMTIAPNGYLGVGTNFPGARVTISNPASNAPALAVVNNSTVIGGNYTAVTLDYSAGSVNQLNTGMSLTSSGGSQGSVTGIAIDQNSRDNSYGVKVNATANWGGQALFKTVAPFYGTTATDSIFGTSYGGYFANTSTAGAAYGIWADVSGATTTSKYAAILYGGNVGIGTTGPLAALDVATTGTVASAIIVPRDSTSNRPSVPVNGMLRYNTGLNAFEGYANGAWTNFAGGGSSVWSTGTSGQAYYTTGNVGVGTAAPAGKLTISNLESDAPALALVSNSATIGGSRSAITLDFTAGQVNQYNTGINLISTGSTGSNQGSNIGLNINQNSRNDDYGVKVNATSIWDGTALSLVNAAFWGTAGTNSAAGQSYGGYFKNTSTAGTAYGIYADTSAATTATKYAAILNGGSVGIGTNAPIYLLTNTSGTSPTGYLTHTASPNGMLWSVGGANDQYAAVFQNTHMYGDGVLIDIASNSHSALRAQSAGSMLFEVSDDYAGAAAPNFNATTGRFIWNSGFGSIGHETNIGTTIYTYGLASPALTLAQTTGYLGIGTSAPASAVHLYPNFSVFTIGNPSASDVSIKLQTNNTAIGWDLRTQSADGGFRIDEGGIANRLFIQKTTGSVGIGTTAPRAGLDVATTGTIASAIIVPRDTIANRPSAPINGMMRYASDANVLEIYQAGAWQSLQAVPYSSVTAATGAHTIDNLNFPQTWSWSTATTQVPLSLTANALTAGGLLSLSSSSPNLNSATGLLNVAYSGTATSGLVARIQSNASTSSGLSVLANGNVGLGTAAPADDLDIYAAGRTVLAVRDTPTSMYGGYGLYPNLQIDAGNTTNAGGLSIKNLGAGYSGLELSAASGGAVSIAGFDHSPVLNFVNKHAVFNVDNNAYDGSSPQSFLFSHVMQPTTMTEFVIREESGQTGDALQIQNSGSSPLLKVGYLGNLVIQKPYYSPGVEIDFNDTTSLGRPGLSVMQGSGYGVASIFVSRATPYNNGAVAFGTNGVAPSAQSPEWLAGIDVAVPGFSIAENNNGNSIGISGNGQTITTRLYVAPGGSVGLGTTAPAAGLDVATTGTMASALIVPRDSIANRPSTPVNGMIRYNSDSSAFEGYSNGAWANLAASGTTSGLWTPGTTGQLSYSAGNVGIGTSQPNSNLQIIGGAGVVVLAQGANSGSYGFRVKDSLAYSGLSGGVVAEVDGNSYYATYGLQLGGIDGASTIDSRNSGVALYLNRNQGTDVVIGQSVYSGALQVRGFGSSSFGGSLGVGTTSPRAMLDVIGAIVSSPATSVATAAVDFSAGNIQYTTQSCQAFQLSNLKDGGSFVFTVKGTTSATCSFTAYSGAGTTGALTVHMPPGHGATTAGTHTLYTFLVAGGDVYVKWAPGY